MKRTRHRRRRRRRSRCRRARARACRPSAAARARPAATRPAASIPAHAPTRARARPRSPARRRRRGPRASRGRRCSSASPADSRSSWEAAAARQNTKTGATRPSFRPDSTLSNPRRRAGTRRSRPIATTGERSVGITTAATTAMTHTSSPGSSARPLRNASRKLSGNAMASSRTVSRGSRPRTPAGLSVASMNRIRASVISTTRSEMTLSTSTSTNGSEPAVSTIPAMTIASAGVTFQRSSRPATSDQPMSIASIAITAFIGVT